MECSKPLAFKSQMYLKRVVAEAYFFFLKESLCLGYLFLKGCSVAPMYVLSPSVLLTVVLYMIQVSRHDPAMGQLAGLRQLHSFLDVASLLLSFLSTRLLCWDKMDSMFGVQL